MPSAFPSLFLKSVGKTPYPGGAVPQGGTTGYVMRVQIQPCATACNDTSYNPATLAPIRTPAMKRLFTGTGTFAKKPAVTRLLTLNEVMGMPPAGAVDPVLKLPYPGGPLEVLVNNTKWSGDSPRRYADFEPMVAGGASELPKEGDTEVWEIVNLTADAHSRGQRDDAAGQRRPRGRDAHVRAGHELLVQLVDSIGEGRPP